MAAIHDLIAQIGDHRLRERLAAEWARASREKKFGRVFEDHLPELLPRLQARPRKGDLVCPRGGAPKDLWRVLGLKAGRVQCQRPQAGAEGHMAETARFALDEVMGVHEFGEPISPALIRRRAAADGGKQFVRLEINRIETIQKLLLIDKPAQLDALFEGVM